MIKADDMGVHIHGSTADVIFDLITAIKAVRETLTNTYGEEHADMLISMCGEVAYADPDDAKKILEKHAEEVKDIAV